MPPPARSGTARSSLLERGPAPDALFVRGAVRPKAMTDPPAGFRLLRRGAAVVWVRPEAESWVQGVLGGAPTLDAAATRMGRTLARGREPVHAVPTPHGTWVVRHYWRGGKVAWVLGDRYLVGPTPRPFLETVASEAVRDRGVRTPRVVAAAVYPGGLVYRGDLMTELVPDAIELADVLFDPERPGPAGAADRREAMAEAGALVAHLGRAGAAHADLNARNVLLEWSGQAPVAYVLDLDRCRVGAAPVSSEPMLQRLIRSIRKLERRTGMKVPESEVRVLVEAARGAA